MLDHHAVWWQIKWYYVFDMNSSSGICKHFWKEKIQFWGTHHNSWILWIIVFCLCLSVYVADMTDMNVGTDGYHRTLLHKRPDSFTTLLWVFPYFLTHTELSFGFFYPARPARATDRTGRQYLVCPSTAAPAYRTAGLGLFIHTQWRQEGLWDCEGGQLETEWMLWFNLVLKSIAMYPSFVAIVILIWLISIIPFGENCGQKAMSIRCG